MVASMDANPDFVEGMRAEGWTSHDIGLYERLGRRQLHPELMFKVSSGGLRLQYLPYSVQEAALKDGVDVLESTGTDSRKIAVHELSAKQAKQVFAKNRVRSLAEQRTFIEEERSKKLPVNNPSAYVIRKGKLVIGGCEFTLAQVLDWARDLSGV